MRARDGAQSRLETVHAKTRRIAVEFYDCLVIGTPDNQPQVAVSDEAPVLAILFQGNVDLPDGSSAYALIREQTIPAISASDLLP